MWIKKYFFSSIVGFSLVLWLSSASAALDLVLTQGISASLPIAVVPFANENQVSVPGGVKITDVIKNDLQNSGEFRVKDIKEMSKYPTTAADVQINDWRKQGVNDIVVGSVQPLINGRYQVNFQLIALYNQTAKMSEKKNSPANAMNNVLASETMTTTQAGLRQLAHHISNVIFKQLTGIRGIFNTKIAYILVQRMPEKATKYSLEIADADGFDPQPLLTSTQPIMSPAWSPDGKQIAYVSFEGNHAAIYLQNVATGKRQMISDSPGINGAPAFSPDGKQLALVLTRTGNPKIYLLNMTTHALTQLTHGYSIDTEPAWAPDGKSILFTSNRGGTPQVYQYNLTTKQIQRVTFSGNYNARASFLPNEQDIVMMHRQDGMFGIATQDLINGNVNVLVQTGNDESPSLAPNGKMVLYATQYGRRGVLAVVSTDGKIKLRLPAREGSVQEPAWSPFLNT